jgi:SAM-dependent methyltransferase
MPARLAADYSNRYDPELDFDHWLTRLTARRIAPFLAADARVLELGSATGLLTASLVGQQRRFLCIERSTAYAARARARDLPGVAVLEIHAEDFAGTEPVDHVLAINLLHEIPDAEAVLARMLRVLVPGGLLHITLPNPRSLHRIVALHAGIIDDLCQISARGERFHTLRLLYAEEVVAMAARLGLAEVSRQAVLIKPLPNAGMEQLPDAVIEGFDSLCDLLPGHGAMTYFVFRKPEAPHG